MNDFTHFDSEGRARMVDVSAKASTERVAKARGTIAMKADTMARIKEGAIKKGDVLAVADVAAVMAAKGTPALIPMCHPIQLSGVEVEFSDSTEGDEALLHITVTTRCVGPTGVEMEAVTAVSGALLTVYDMCKAVDRGMRITNVELIEKSGGKSGLWTREEK